MTDLPTRLRDQQFATATTIEAAAEIERLSEILTGIEILTATGEGLDPEQTISIHLIAAEGRADDPAAWRADPAMIERLRAAVKAELGDYPPAQTIAAARLADHVAGSLGLTNATEAMVSNAKILAQHVAWQDSEIERLTALLDEAVEEMTLAVNVLDNQKTIKLVGGKTFSTDRMKDTISHIKEPRNDQ